MISLNQFTLILVLLLSFLSSLRPLQATLFMLNHVHTINNLPGDFTLHSRTLHTNEEQLIHFQLQFFKRTPFFCSAQWEGRFKHFDAF
ncbi:hypothetical protein ACJRO7_031639 [Eucalyptus globulus]|uniref:S-protein homolog n=1 Tax=Eucalyptus globulus TaxID=34317 RepID=A0ABD3JLR5_EUCGL